MKVRIMPRLKIKKKLLPILLIGLLIALNIFAFNFTKSYFSKDGYQEVEVLTESKQSKNKSFHLLVWTYELFKSFRNMNNH
ncbi:MAG: hypothetical protein J5I91_01225 [Bacteroidetes bacterium]|nr:hypothetical protein [Bacteroidota bacterium]